MKANLMRWAFIALMLVLGACSAVAQMATVKGTCKDADGKPIVGAVVEFQNIDSGRKYDLKTNGKGEFLSIAIDYGHYNITLSKDGKVLDKINKKQLDLGENPPIDFDLKKSEQEAAQQQGISPEQLQKMKAENEKANKENNTVKSLNEKLALATQATTAGDFDTAISVLNDATQIDPTRDLLWFKLGDAYRSSAAKQTDPAEKTKRIESSITDYEKAIDLKQKAIAAGSKNPAEDNKNLAAYYNNLAEAYSKDNRTDDAVKAYGQAAQLNPTGAAQYYFNLGAILTNAGKVDDALAAFDKCIAADPTKAAAYYWKGVNMIGKATLKGDKMVAPDGTAEAFNKYLQLDPNGQFAEPAKQMLASIGGTVETEFGKSKKATTKKQ